MSKKAIILNGTPRLKKGNTIVLVNWANELLKQAGWHVEQHDLYKMDFRGCTHCDMCKKIIDKPGCILNDDFNAVLQGLTDADLIVVASPVYCWSVTGSMGSALDRFYALFKNNISLMQDKKLLGMFTSAGDAFEGMDLCVSMLKHLCKFGGAEYLDTIAATGCTTQKELLARTELKRYLEQVIMRDAK